MLIATLELAGVSIPVSELIKPMAMYRASSPLAIIAGAVRPDHAAVPILAMEKPFACVLCAVCKDLLGLLLPQLAVKLVIYGQNPSIVAVAECAHALW